MFARTALALSLASFAFSANAQDLSKGKWVDLTHSFNEKSVYWPTAEMFKKTEVFAGYTEGGFYYSAYNFSAAEHGGTHMDSPIHFAEGAFTADQVPLEQLIGPGFVIDVSAQAAKNVDYLVTAADTERLQHVGCSIDAVVELRVSKANDLAINFVVEQEQFFRVRPRTVLQNLLQGPTTNGIHR